MSESVTIKFQYSMQEYAKAIRLHYETQDLTPGVVAVAGCIGVGLWLWNGHKLNREGLLWLAVLALFLSLMLYRLFVFPRFLFRLDPKLADERELTFSPEHVFVHTHDLDSRIQWSFYTTAVVGEDFFLLYSGKHFFTAIPKRAFTDAAALQIFENLLVSFIPDIKRLA